MFYIEHTAMAEYIIYCRKSSEESSGQQAQSIPNQIHKCVEYAKNNSLQVAMKPEDFSMFEDKWEIAKEDAESDVANRRLYKETRDLFIIKEQKTAKIPWAREKRKTLIKWVKKWKIKGILSYSPDRQSRNMMEWWELIDLVDQWLVDLKYTNFHFEPTASGKMMLWIWFVFSKQYADKLSEDITRGNKSKKAKWKSLNKYKYGYITNEEGYYEPHPKYFDLMRRAFEMKIYENKSNPEIADRLNANGYIREFKTWARPVSHKRLWDVWKNTLYYGIYVSKNEIYDLRELNPHFKPMITEEEYDLLQEKLRKPTKPRAINDENEAYYPFDKWLVVDPDGNSFSCTLPNPKRFRDKLAELKKTKKNATLGDVVNPKNIHFRVMNTWSKYHNTKVGFDVIQDKIVECLNKLKIDEKADTEYVEFAKTQADVVHEKRRTEANRIQVRINKLSSDRKDYIKRHMAIDFSDAERKIYNEEVERYDNQIELLEKERSEIDLSERNEIVELRIFLDMLNKSGEYFRKASYVQKRRISKILFSNIVIDNKKRLTIAVNPAFESLFAHVMKMPGIEPGSESH